jgi:hypothetical protein
VTLLDRPIAASGRLAAALRARGRWVPRAAIAGLLAVFLIPIVIVAATPQPTVIAFEDLKAGLLPPMTSWLRLEGELRPVPDDLRPSTIDVPYLYTLTDSANDRLSVSIEANAPLEVGHGQVTGRISGAGSVPGTVSTITVDVPTEPERHDPWLLLAVPAILAALIVVGQRSGYPVVRRDRPPRSPAPPLRPDDSLVAKWSGRIGSDVADRAAMRPCTVAVTTDVDVCQLFVHEAGTARTVATRRASPKSRLRICWTDGCKPALEIHASMADILLMFENVADRDRLAASLE